MKIRFLILAIFTKLKLSVEIYEATGNVQRPCPTGNDKYASRVAAIFRGGLAHKRLELRTERPETRIAATETNVGYRKMIRGEHLFRIIDSKPGEKPVRRLSEGGGKQPM